MRLPVLLLSAVSVLAVSQVGLAQAPAADNSANNRSEGMHGQHTADQQSNSKADVELTQRIRRSVMEDDKLSVYGQNVKIVAMNGKVTLNGVVRTAAEKNQIGMKATAIAGKDAVTNGLTIAPAN